MEKTCNKCGVSKPLSEFYNRSGARDHTYSACKDCTNEYVRSRYKNDPEAKQKRIANYQRRRDDPQFIEDAKNRSRKFYQSVSGRARTLLHGAKRSPNYVSLSLDHIIKGIERGFCPVTGIKFDLTDDHQRISGRAKNPYSPSLDRIDSRKGYTDENTRIVIWQYNMMKGELTDREVAFICEQILANLARKMAA